MELQKVWPDVMANNVALSPAPHPSGRAKHFCNTKGINKKIKKPKIITKYKAYPCQAVVKNKISPGKAVLQ